MENRISLMQNFIRLIHSDRISDQKLEGLFYELIHKTNGDYYVLSQTLERLREERHSLFLFIRKRFLAAFDSEILYFIEIKEEAIKKVICDEIAYKILEVSFLKYSEKSEKSLKKAREIALQILNKAMEISKN